MQECGTKIFRKEVKMADIEKRVVALETDVLNELKICRDKLCKELGFTTLSLNNTVSYLIKCKAVFDETPKMVEEAVAKALQDR